MAGLAYEWAPDRWQRLRLRDGIWRGELPAPALPGIHRLQFRFDDGGKRLSSGQWLLRVFPRGTAGRRRWPQAALDRRPRLHRLFMIA